MTGFLVVAGDEAWVRRASERIRSSYPDEDSGLDQVLNDGSVEIFATGDLGIRQQRGLTIVCDGITSSVELYTGSLQAQRSQLSKKLLEAFELDAADGALSLQEHHYVVWDGRCRHLFASRDALGVKPIFVHEDGRLVIIASSQRLIARAVADRGPIDRDSVQRFALGEPPKPLRTYFQQTRSLAPGHRLTWSSNGVSEQRVLPEPLDNLASTADTVVQLFREVLELAIARRLGEPSETVTLLSGGLDSSAITQLASQSEVVNSSGLRSLTLEFDASCFPSETAFADLVGVADRLEKIKVVCDEPTLLQDIDRQLREQGGLFLAPALYLGPSLYRKARNIGAVILLDGHGGDEAISFGWGRLQELAEAGAWRKLLEELKHVAPQARRSALGAFFSFYLLYGPLNRITRLVIRGELSLRRRVGRPRTDPRFGVVARAQRGTLQASLKEDRARAPSVLPEAGAEFRRHMGLIANPRQISAFEILDAASSAVGVSARYPFWDRDLLRFCLVLPSREKLDDGFGRLILRKALPELHPSVRWRRDKFDFSPVLAHALCANDAERLQHLLEAPSASPIWTYFDKRTVAGLIRKLRRMKRRTPGDVAQALWRFAVTSIWLENLES